MFRKNWILLLILVFTLLFTACNESPPEDENPIKQNEEEGVRDTNSQEEKIQDEIGSKEGKDLDSNDKNLSTEYGSSKISKEDAYNIFKQEYPEVKIQKIEVDESNEKYFYKIKGYDGSKEYRIKINMRDGQVSKKERESDEEIDGEISKEDVEKVNGFLEKALDEVNGDYMIHEWELKSKDKGTLLEIELVDESRKNKKEYEYNIETGELVKERNN